MWSNSSHFIPFVKICLGILGPVSYNTNFKITLSHPEKFADILIGIIPNVQINLGRIDRLRMVTLPFHKYNTSFFLLLKVVFCLFPHHFIILSMLLPQQFCNYISKYCIFSRTIKFLKIFCLHMTVLIYKKLRICVSVLFPVVLLEARDSSIDSFGFPMYIFMSSVNQKSFLSFQSVAWFFFLILLIRISSTTLNNSGENRNFALLLMLGESVLFFIIKHNVSCRLFLHVLNQVEIIPSIFSFCHEWVLNIVKFFLMLIDTDKDELGL